MTATHRSLVLATTRPLISQDYAFKSLLPAGRETLTCWLLPGNVKPGTSSLMYVGHAPGQWGPPLRRAQGAAAVDDRPDRQDQQLWRDGVCRLARSAARLVLPGRGAVLLPAALSIGIQACDAGISSSLHSTFARLVVTGLSASSGYVVFCIYGLSAWILARGSMPGPAVLWHGHVRTIIAECAQHCCHMSPDMC